MWYLIPTGDATTCRGVPVTSNRCKQCGNLTRLLNVNGKIAVECKNREGKMALQGRYLRYPHLSDSAFRFASEHFMNKIDGCEWEYPWSKVNEESGSVERIEDVEV